MSQYDDDDFDDFGNDPNANTPLVKNLRKQLNNATKAAKDLEERAVKAEKQVRARTVADVLKEKGANPGLARYVLADVEDPTAESVNSWLTTNGDLFGYKPPAPAAGDIASMLGLPAGSELPPDLKQAYEKFTNAGQGTQRPNAQSSEAAALADPNLTHDQLLALIASSGR